MQSLNLLIKPVSSLCDLACEYCFYAKTASERSSSKPEVMTPELMRVIIDKALSEKPSSLSLIFQGGEPLLAGIDFYRDITEYVKKVNTDKIPVNYTIQTNGCKLNDIFSAFFKKNSFLVGISLDGKESAHNAHRKDKCGKGTYASILRGIESLRRYDVSFNILTVMTREVCSDPVGCVEALSGFSHIQLIPYIPESENDPRKPTSEELASLLTCFFNLYAERMRSESPIHIRDFDGYLSMIMGGAPTSCAQSGRCGGYLAIEADGSVYPCDFYMDDRHLIGSVKSSSLEELTSSKKYIEFIYQGAELPHSCSECRFLSLCRGGCRRYYNEGAQLYCEAYRIFFTRCAPLLIELAKFQRERMTEK